MPALEKLVINGYKPFIPLNESLVSTHKHQRVFNTIDEESDFSINLLNLFKFYPETVIDKHTLLLIQIEDLHKAIDYSTTGIGSATLFRSLIQPPTSLDLVLAKQESLRELESNDTLRNALTDYLGEFRNGEDALFTFLNNEIDLRFPYYTFKAAMRAGKNISKAASSIPIPETKYARILVENIRDFENSLVYKLMRGPIYRTFDGLKSREDIQIYTPRWRFRPTSFTIGFLGGPLVLAGLITGVSTGLIERGEHLLPYGTAAMVWAVYGSLYGLAIKHSTDYSTVIQPLRKKTVGETKFISAMDSIGKLDELLSFIDYRKAMLHETTLPTITDERVHYFIAENLRNPIQAKENSAYVPNPVNLNGKRLTFITGPNSGGKTSYCKSIFQNQLLGQIGSYVVASKARMNIADKMAYQAPQFDALQDEEGRFGTELKRTRDIFYATSPKSLVILDELAEGTTIEEKLQQSHLILNGFYTIGNNTILVTHNHELVDSFKDENKGQYLQVEFNGKNPTHRLIEGISRESHADRIAEKIGFSEKDIQQYLVRKGYLKNLS